MQFQKLTFEQRSIKRWRERRNHLVCKIMDEQGVPSYVALQMAKNQLKTKSNPGQRRERRPQPTAEANDRK